MNRYLMGWIGYSTWHPPKHTAKTSMWIRRRLRMCLWKQWKLPKTRAGELRALGIPGWAALTMANSRRGAWEMSRNTNNALNTSFWEARGLKMLDQNLYQAVKGMSVAIKIVKRESHYLRCRMLGRTSQSRKVCENITDSPDPEKLLRMIEDPGFQMYGQWQVQKKVVVQV